MSETLFLNAIKGIDFKNMDDLTLTNVAESLDIIIDSDTFSDEIQEEAYCKRCDARDVMVTRADQITEMIMKEAKVMHDMQKVAEKQNAIDEHEEELYSDNDQLVRLMIRSEQDGSLSFEFRGIKWDWDHISNVWNFTKKDA